MKAPYAFLALGAFALVPLSATSHGTPDPPPHVSAAPSADSAVAHSTYQWPTGAQARVLRPYMPPALKWQSGHRGVDLEANEGAIIYAAGPGRVIYAGTLVDRGVVSIEHADGIRTTYEPVTALVRRGDDVEAGSVIGTLESGHCADQACLHWGAKRGSDSYLDPLSLLRARSIRLLE